MVRTMIFSLRGRGREVWRLQLVRLGSKPFTHAMFPGHEATAACSAEPHGQGTPSATTATTSNSVQKSLESLPRQVGRRHIKSRALLTRKTSNCTAPGERNQNLPKGSSNRLSSKGEVRLKGTSRKVGDVLAFEQPQRSSANSPPKNC